MRIRFHRSRRFQGACLAIASTLLALRFLPHERLGANLPRSTAVYADKGELLRLTLAEDEQYRQWVPLDRISPLAVEAVIRYEDRWFRYHPGVNPVSLFRAVGSLFGPGRRLGGSTLTMQLARRLYGIDSRRPWGKIQQAAAALWIEARHSKADILEAYLNLAPYGGNLEGIAAASRRYFGKAPDRLALPEALALALLPQNPNRRSQAMRAPNTGPELRGLVARLGERLPIQDATIGDQRLARLGAPARAEGLPFLAPHFVDHLLADPRRQGDLHTTLSLPLQRLLERQVRRLVESRRSRGVQNAAALLIDTRDMGVRGLVGSADFHDEAIQGQVSAIPARRSPGSVLKPFVYALGMEQGVIHPRSILRDVPVSFSAYSPENFDGRFMGPLTATEALVRSRNIPALLVAAQLDHPSFHQFLVGAGVHLPMPEAHYGLGLALGTGDVSMEDVAMLYAALANQGVLRPLRYLDTDPRVDGVRILSEESAWLTIDMLIKNPRPQGPRIASADHLPPLPWKTGTSWGFRDAWSAGLVGPYVLVVWVGDFAGRSNPAFVGVESAAPLFFGVVDALAADRPLPSPRWARPPKVVEIDLCAESGHLPNPLCPRLQKGWFIAGRSPSTTCTVHREFTLDTAGRRLCQPAGPGRRVVYEVWPTEFLKIFSAAGLPRQVPPPPAPGCEKEQSADGHPPRITSPLAGTVYGLRPGKEQLPFLAEADGDTHAIFWYVDRQFAGKSQGGKPWFWTMAPGDHVVRAVDDRGRSDAQPLHVELEP